MEQTLIAIFDRYKFFLDFNFLIEARAVLIEETAVVIEAMAVVIEARLIGNGGSSSSNSEFLPGSDWFESEPPQLNFS
jgi:hypothetical protein